MFFCHRSVLLREVCHTSFLSLIHILAVSGDESNDETNYNVINKDTNLKIVSYCIKNVEYFWMADVIDKIIDSGVEDCIQQLSQKQLLDLSSIQSSISKFCNDNIDIINYRREIKMCIRDRESSENMLMLFLEQIY